MKITFTGTETILLEAVAKSNELLSNPEFYNAIRSHHGFDYSTATPVQIADFIETAALTFHVQLYKGKKRNRVLGYVKASYPNKLFLNERKLDRPVEDIVATIIHESIHAVDHAVDQHLFGHKGNRPEGNQNTAPYWIGKLAKQLSVGTPLQAAIAYAGDTDMEFNIQEELIDTDALLVG